jgi:hypothetical protein
VPRVTCQPRLASNERSKESRWVIRKALLCRLSARWWINYARPMSNNSEYDEHPCSVCAALVPSANMQDHLKWHDSLVAPVPKVDDHDEGRQGR